MKKIRIIAFVLMALCIVVPAYRLTAQDSLFASAPGTEVAATKTEAQDKTDKKKEKDVVEINAVFFISLLINIVTLALIIVFIYYPQNHKLEFIFTFFMFNLLIFMLTFVLNKIKVSMGAAFGLFAVFSMLRYRTEGISMKDMTYLFIFIAVGLISAIQLEYYELGIINGLIIVFTFIFDGNILFTREKSLVIEYENIELIKPDKKQELLNDLRLRTGLNVHRFSIQDVSFLKDSAEVKIYYYD